MPYQIGQIKVGPSTGKRVKGRIVFDIDRLTLVDPSFQRSFVRWIKNGQPEAQKHRVDMKPYRCEHPTIARTEGGRACPDCGDEWLDD